MSATIRGLPPSDKWTRTRTRLRPFCAERSAGLGGGHTGSLPHMADVESSGIRVPWAWITSRWMVEVAAQRPLEIVGSHLAPLRHKDRDYATEFPEGYVRRHTQGCGCCGSRRRCGRRRVRGHADLYAAFGGSSTTTATVTRCTRRGHRRCPRRLGHKRALAEAADGTEYDDIIMAETTEALDRCGGFVGTPVISFAPPDGRASSGR